MRTTWAVVFCTIMLVAGLVGNCLAAGTLVVGLEAEPTSLDPHQLTDYNSVRAAAALFETLTQFKPGTTEIMPALAESWDLSEDGLTYTFHLREGVFFHAGVRQCVRTRISQVCIYRGLQAMRQTAHVQHSSWGAKLRRICSAT